MPPVSSRRPPAVDALEPRVLFLVDNLISISGPPPRPGPSPALSAPAVRVTLDYRFDAGNFFDTPQKRDALRQAAEAAVRVLRGVSTSVESAGRFEWEATLEDPATGQPTAVSDLSVGWDELVLFPGARELDGGGSTGDGLSHGMPGRFKRPGMPELDQTSDAGAPERGGGSVVFDPTPDRPWHFDPATAPAAGAYDFTTAATRAVAQALGFGTGRRWTMWRPHSGDFFEPLTDAFQGPLTVAAHNPPGDTSPVPLDPTARYFADADDDEAPASAMRATLRPGERRTLSPLDYAALRDIGWYTVSRAATSLAARAPSDVTSPVLIDVTYEGMEPWGPEQLRLYPPYDSVFAAPPPVYEGPPLYVGAVGEPQVLGPTIRRITYAFGPPGGTWDASETGSFLIAIEGGPDAGTIGTFTFDPGTPPTSRLATTDLTVPSSSPHRLVVSHEDNQSLDLSGLAADDLIVTGPGGTELVVTGSALAPGVGPARRDFLAQPPGAAWGPEDNGVYTVSLRPGRVRDAAGNVAPGGPLGTFEVAIRPLSLPGARLVDAGSGRAVTVTLRGPGTISVYPAAIGSADVGLVELKGTTEATTLVINGPGEGYAGAYVRGIVTSGSLGAILAPSLRLDGPITVAGALRRLRLNATNGGAVRVGPGRGLDVSINQAAGLTLESQSPILSLTVGGWVRSGGPVASRVVAPSIKSITTLNPNGSFEADVMTGSLGRARFAGTLRDATLWAADSIGSIAAAHVYNSRVFAGVREGVTGLPTSAADFAAPAASIKAVSVKGVLFASMIAAPTVGRVSMQNTSAGIGGAPHGVTADRLGALSVSVLALRLTRLDDPAASWVGGDLALRIL